MKCGRIRGRKSIKFCHGAWTQQETDHFFDALRIYGTNWTKVRDAIGTRSRCQVVHKARIFREQSMRESRLVDPILLEIVQRPYSRQYKAKSEVEVQHWSIEEHERFVEAIRLYGKDWDKIEIYVATRTKA